MPIKLEMKTTDPEKMELAVRYWAMSETGEFVEKVVDLVPFRDIVHSGTLAAHVREWCRAYDENLTCPDCGACREVTSRSAVKRFPQKSPLPCSDCRTIRERVQREARAAETAALEAQLSAYIAQLPSTPIDYQQLSDDQALLLLALNAALSPRLGSAAFCVSDCKAIAPLDVSVFIDRLRSADAIREAPLDASPGTYYLQDGELWLQKSYVAYRLAPDIHFGATDEALSVLIEREYSDTSALFDLWLDFATADAMRYFFDKCTAFNHDVDVDQFKEIRSTLREALKTWSVSQVWFVAWKCVKDAASLARLVYYSEARATATLPGKIRRALEKAEKDETNIRKWDRPDHQPSGTLGMLFTEMFGIDEDTPGKEVLSRLKALRAETSAVIQTTPQAEPVRRWLGEALINDNGPQMLRELVELTREGHDIDHAIGLLLASSSGSHA
ncbi:hypothetical protein N5D61_03550 [Pseudomonas sp. GD03842]|uniref:hypothetical protein n=1 Tax=Pseudomonas sp. GD03842 TaxID=2975385 RepID=UPI00244B28EB|nr:hypothetical protein [Pseudomonas sp. GD03842]MDH0745420.1 hypothetical protein [Pseudomonas sp. GD03842]